MIDWVSIVRHSRRRFSNYMYGVPHKVRRKRRQKQNEDDNAASPHASNCSCCWVEENVQVFQIKNFFLFPVIKTKEFSSIICCN